MSDKLYNKAITWASDRGFSNIKANFGDYERPTPYSRPKEDKPYIPDITGRKSGAKCYIEIANKEEDQKRSISKWKLLSTLAKLKGGKFFLLAPRGHKAYAERMLKKYRLDAHLIYMPAI